MKKTKKRAIIVGSSGQDGRLLYDLLIRRGYAVLGLDRARSRSTEPKFAGKNFNVGKPDAIARLVGAYKPTEIYYLAAVHHSSQQKQGDDLPLFVASFDTNTLGAVYFLDAIKNHSPKTRFFYAASSHVFGSPKKSPQTEATPIDPENIYGISKAAGIFACRYYRRAHGIFACAGILYNHESTLRSETFVSKKIVSAAVAIHGKKAKTLELGDLSARVDWGYAPDYVEAMTRILALPHAEDFVVATGKPHTIGDFARIAFAELGLVAKNHIRIRSGIIHKPKMPLVGNAAKLRKKAGWQPSMNFENMVKTLVREHSATAKLARS